MKKRLRRSAVGGLVAAALFVCGSAQAAQLWTAYSPSQQIELSISAADGTSAIAAIPAPRGVRLYVVVDTAEAGNVKVEAHATHAMRYADAISLERGSLNSDSEGHGTVLKHLSNLALAWKNSDDRGAIVHRFSLATEHLESCTRTAIDAFVTLGWAQLETKSLDAARATGEGLRRRCEKLDRSGELYGRWLHAEADMRQGHYEAARAGYSSLIALVDAADLPPEWRWHLLRISGNLGIACIQHAYTQAAQAGMRECFDILNDALAQADAAGDYKLAANLLNLMAPYHWSQRDYTAAGETLSLSRAFLELAGTTDDLAGILNNLALNEGWRGNLREAQRLLRDSLALVIDPDSRALVLRNLAKNYQTLGELALAERYYRRALATFVSARSDRGVASAKLSLGSVIRLRGRPAEALALHQEALDYYVTEVSARHTSSLLEIAQDQLALHHLEDASASAAQAIRIGGESGSEVLRYQAELLATEIALAGGDLASSRSRMAQIQSGDFPNPPLEAQLQRAGLGLRFAAAIGDVAMFAREGEHLQNLIAAVREDIAGGQMELRWIDLTSELTDLYLAGIMNGDAEPSPATLFEIVERTKGIALRVRRQSLEGHTQSANGAEGAATELARLVAAESQLAGAAVDERAAARTLVDEAREAYLAAAPYTQTKVELKQLSLAQLMQRLSEDQALVLFHSGTQTSFAIVVTAAKARVEKLGSTADLEASVSRFRDIAQQDNSRLAPVLPALQSLLATLISDSKIKHLIAVTDGALSQLPLSAIHIGGDGYRPFGEGVSVVYTPSASAYFEDARTSASYFGDIAVFADPAFDERVLAQISTQTVFRNWSTGLGRLPHSALEANKIIERFPGLAITLATGADATAQRLVQKPFTHSRIVHIATHGYYDPDTPDIVGLAAAPEPASSQPGFLSLSRLATVPYGARLVVISGCETALGESVRGEGLNGLARALLAQGVDSVIGTLWPISDNATAAFMSKFYEQLAANGGDAENALQTAQEYFRASRRYRAPRNWAGFSLVVTGQSYKAVLNH